MATASREFQVFVKPAGATCNLECRYCYYLEKHKLFPAGTPSRMPDDLLEAYIAQHIAACPVSTVLFAWHGGEPTLLGVDYFRRIVDFQRRHRAGGREILNDIQTNGTLLDEEWCRFLAEEKFFVGLSLDGPQRLHDDFRVTKSMQPTHDKVMHGLSLLQRFGIDCDALCVVHARNVHHPGEVYRFFKENGVRHLVFIPLVNRAGGGAVSAESVPAQAFGAFLCAVFDEWLAKDAGRVHVQVFEEALRPMLGEEHALCVHRKTCGELPVLEHDGSFYSCDHYVDPAHRIGNIREQSLLEVLESPAQRSFGQAKWDSLPESCRQCDVLDLCNGGCPKDRFIEPSNGGARLNYLCAGYKQFFSHARPQLGRLAAFMRSGQPIERFAVAARSREAGAATRRNDPCPCGSGRKYKKCCLRE